MSADCDLRFTDPDQAHPVEDLDDRPAVGLTVREFARRYRVGKDRVLGWIRRGELRAVNTAGVMCGKPRYIIPPEALAEFEKRRDAGPPPKPPRRRRLPEVTDYWPD
jgi:hypothetical protein